MAVSRCVCHEVPFQTLAVLADELRGWGVEPTFELLSQRTRCGTGCGMCQPYIRLLLETGQTDFPVLGPVTLARMLREAQEARARQHRENQK
ncbi:MAG: hypothetical protein ACF8SC_09930 [Phycisphaerales bacterium JB037]